MKTWILRLSKWVGFALFIVVALGILDLYTFQLMVQDPGYYVVARRSDTPSQVLDALDRLEKGNSISSLQARTLVRRYQAKVSLKNLSPEEKQQWEQAHRKALSLYQRTRSDNGL